MRLQAPHCPACGAPIDVPPEVSRVTCGYCTAVLIVTANTVTTQHPHGQTSGASTEASAATDEPDATLRNWATARFELSLIEQSIPGAVPAIFAGVELSDERFAFVSARVVDSNRFPVVWPLDAAFAELKRSLEDDSDPGLAANLALETLCAKRFDHRFECAIAMFEPKHMRVTPYSAGANDSILWASSEEGRSMTVSSGNKALERKSLRERGEHFTNGAARSLAASDVKIVAVRPILPEPIASMPSRVVSKVLKSRNFELAFSLNEKTDHLKLVPLHKDRQVAVWLSSPSGQVSDAVMKTFTEAVLWCLIEKITAIMTIREKQAGRRSKPSRRRLPQISASQ